MENNEIIKKIKESKNKKDVGIKIYGYYNGKISKKVNDLLDIHNLSNYFDKETILNYCLNCGKTISKYNKFCDRSCAAIYNNKKRGPRSEETKEKIRNSLYGKEGWRKGKKNGIYKKCPICNNMFYVSPSKEKSIYCSKKCYLKDKDLKYRNNGNGGYRKGSGIGKKGYYKGYWCDSSYELAWIIYHLEHNIKFKRNLERFEYVYENEKHYYIPDFIKNGEYYELKGYLNKKCEQKHKQFPYKLNVLYKNDLKDIFIYVENKYGKKFTKLYD